METIEKKRPEASEKKPEIGRMDPRVDEHAGNMLDDLGVPRDEEGRLPDHVVETYNDFKRVVNTLQPGREIRAPEAWAFVLGLARLKQQLGE